ncbi:MAG: hypothetical protein KBB83_02425 [Alphaproteobacteria bacterium]|nr:hypothetical protein [Alphaproteobacteria bacterium]
MNKTIKYLSTSLALFALLNGGPLRATDVLEPVIAAPTQPVSVDGDKGKDEAVPVVVSSEGALISAADLMQLTTFITAMKTFREQVKSMEGKSEAEREALLMNLIFRQGGIATDSVNLLDTLIKKINIVVQSVNAAPNSKCKSCQTCFATAAHGAGHAAEEFNRLFPLVQKYYDLITRLEGQNGTDALGYITALVNAGAMKDLTYLLEFTDRYKQYDKAQKQRIAANEKRPAFLRAKAAAPAPIKPLTEGNPAFVEDAITASIPKTAILTAADLQQITDFMEAMKKFRKAVKDNEGRDQQAKESELMAAILDEGGLAKESLDLVSTLAQKINVAVQSVTTEPNGRGRKCQSCWQASTVGTTFGLDELNAVLPLIQKYYNLETAIKANGGADAVTYVDEYVKAGILKDLTYLVNFTERYKAYAAAEYEKRGSV